MGNLNVNAGSVQFQMHFRFVLQFYARLILGGAAQYPCAYVPWKNSQLNLQYMM